MNTTLASLGVLACLAACTVVGVVLGRWWEREDGLDPGWTRYHNHPAVPSVVQVVHAGLVGPHVRYCDHHQQWGRLVVGFADGTTMALDNEFGELTEVAPAVSDPTRVPIGRRLPPRRPVTPFDRPAVLPRTGSHHAP